MGKTKTWFPEVMVKLKHPAISGFNWKELIELNAEINLDILRIRARDNVKPIRYGCPGCGNTSSSYPAPVTIRAMLFAMERGGYLTGKELDDLDKKWQSYKRRNKLDGHGKPKPGSADYITNQALSYLEPSVIISRS